MNIKRILRGTFRRITPNVMGTLPVTEMTVKKRTRLPEPVVRFLATAASVALLLGACWGGYAYFRALYDGPLFHGSHSTLTDPFGTTGSPTNPTETQKPTDPPKPTETTPPTTDPLPTDPLPTDPLPTDPLPTDPLPSEPMTDGKYNNLPSFLIAYVHDINSHWLYKEFQIDTSDCVKGWLYIFDKETKEATVICDETVMRYCANYEYIYYVTAENPDTVVQSTLDGKEKKEVYIGGTITHLDGFGGVNSKLAIVEDYSDIIVYDLITDTRQVIFSYHDVFAVYIDNWESGYIELYINNAGVYGCDLETGEIWLVHGVEDT